MKSYFDLAKGRGCMDKSIKKNILAVLLLVLMFAMCLSGCSLITPKDNGVALYNQVAKYLPENAIHNPELYEVEEYSATGMTQYRWAEEQVYLPEVLFETYSEAGPDNAIHGYQISNCAPEYYIYEHDGKQNIFRYMRELKIVIDENGEVAHIEYWNKENEDNYTGVFHGMDNTAALAIVEDAVKCFIPKEEHVIVQPNPNFAMHNGKQSYRVYGKLYDYAIDVMLDGGYIQGFSRMSNNVYRQQVIDWLATERTRLYRNYYNVLSNETTISHETVDGKYYVVELMHTMRYKNDGNPDDVPYIQELKDTNPTEYQRHYDDYNKEQESNLFLKIKAEINENERLDLENAVIYNEIPGNKVAWEAIDGLYCFVKDGKPEPNWTSDKTMALATAYSYICSLQNEFLGFTIADDLYVRHAGTIANGNEEYTRDYQWMLQMLGTEDWVTLYRNYKYEKTERQTVLEQLLNSMQSKYALLDDFEDAEQIVLEVELIPKTGGVDNIILTLEDIENQWMVTNVKFQCVR